jgi:kynurenine formamidase|tara:strand:+ start:8330 stop:9139 length:810 start_codon:yes stop_codon:yes gene_type:complete
MIIGTTINGSHYSIDTSTAIDLSIPYNFNGKQPNFYDVEQGKLSSLKAVGGSWSVTNGASCNVPEISMNIHCSGTHTESVGHLLKNPGDIGTMLIEPLISAVVITVDPEVYSDSPDNYHCHVNGNERVISADMISVKYKDFWESVPDALIIRTKPNQPNKRFMKYSQHPPPFLTNNAMSIICQTEVKHLIVDTPSVDRMSDDGILGNHHIFWGDGLNPKCKVNPKSKKTITELAYIPNSIEDGFYFLNIQIPHFVCDAAPSRPLLYRVI